MRGIKPMFEVLVHVPDMLERTKKTANKDVLIFSDFGNVENTVRYGKVLETPMFFKSIILKGDIIHFHHNIVRRSLAIDGTVQHGNYEIDRRNGLYLCPLDQIFGIERDGEFKALSPFCFVKPIENQPITEKNGIFSLSGDTEKPFLGIMKYGNDYLEGLGINEGDQVIFKQWSMYEFKVNGERLYRMKSNKILGKWA